MRHAVRMPAGDLQEMSVKTILSQAHLSPLPQRLSPIYWGWDHALPIRVANIREIKIPRFFEENNQFAKKNFLTPKQRLFPLPDVLVLADSYQEYNLTSSGVVCLNPSSFAKDGSFHVYYPNHRNVEISKVPLWRFLSLFLFFFTKWANSCISIFHYTAFMKLFMFYLSKVRIWRKSDQLVNNSLIQ